jgi:predicted nucleic acid-binding protein
MMQAVIDSSSLIFAFKLEKTLKLLKTRFDGLLLPRTVHEEVVGAGRKLGKEEVNSIEEEIKNGFLRVKEPANLIEAEHLGKGEMEAISLAHQEGLPVIIDDRRARILGVSIKLKVIPISSFILWGVKKGLLTGQEGKEILNELVKAGYWLRSDVYLSLIEAMELDSE